MEEMLSIPDNQEWRLAETALLEREGVTLP
jgi:hypothetical protein